MKLIVCPRCRELHLFEEHELETYKAILPCVTNGRLHKQLAVVTKEYVNLPPSEQSRPIEIKLDKQGDRNE